MTQSAPKAQISATPLPRERSALVQALLRGVEGIAPIIARNKAASEHARSLAPEVVEAMRDTGLLMMKSPYEVGGAEIHPVDQMAVVEAVTYLDSAAA
ncbi:MAG: acyl-CoA dehydrogenase family protein, partial [Pseudomonadales bacterium]|nr:acyl-CoA dehydrogenase family protein [Pseudomonadales bacterium]